LTTNQNQSANLLPLAVVKQINNFAVRAVVVAHESILLRLQLCRSAILSIAVVGGRGLDRG
jgi:hypothetical protein